MAELADKELTGRIIAAAIAVHRALGPGFLESVYRVCRIVSAGLWRNRIPFSCHYSAYCRSSRLVAFRPDMSRTITVSNCVATF